MSDPYRSPEPQITPELLKKGKIRRCPCGSLLFDTGTTAVIQISKLVAQTDNDIEVPIRLLICKSCGKVPSWSDTDNVLPNELKTKSKTK